MKLQKSPSYDEENSNSVLVCNLCGGLPGPWCPADVPRMVGHIVRFCQGCWSLVDEMVPAFPMSFLERMGGWP